MNIISVDYLPRLAVIPKGTTHGTTKSLIPQARCLPPLAMVSKGHMIGNNAGVESRPPPLTIVSNGKAISTAAGNYRVPPPKIISKGKVSACNATLRSLDEDLVSKGHVIGNNAGVESRPPPLTIVSNGKAISTAAGNFRVPPPKIISKGKMSVGNAAVKRLREGKTLQQKRNFSPKKPLVVKTYDNVSAPAPFFGPFKSRIPLSLKQDGEPKRVDSATYENGWIPPETSISFNPGYDVEMNSIVASSGSVPNHGDQNVFIVETADKAVQTECCCHCSHGQENSDSGKQEILEEIKKISSELKELKLNITGKTATKLMDGLFPITSEANLIKIQHNMDNTENFALRLKLHLKYQKPKSSTTIGTAVFQQLISDEFLKGKNWDGGNNFEAINKYEFFQTTLFDAWKNSAFNKNIYVAAMRHEIGKSHDRERKRNKTN